MFTRRTLLFTAKKLSCISTVQRILCDTKVNNGSFNKQHSDFWPRRFVEKLTQAEKVMLSEELAMHGIPVVKLAQECSSQSNNSSQSSNSNQNVAVSYSQLRMGFVPFVGFGFLDNAIMIVAGFQPWQVGCLFINLLSPPAAGLGNLVSDLFGIGMVGYVERFSEKLGCSFPALTAEQLSANSVRRATILGRITGITIGCLLGMLPLLWFDYSSHPKSEEQNP